MTMNAYKLSEEEHMLAREIAYRDVSNAFRWYLDNENKDRPLLLAALCTEERRLHGRPSQ